MGGVWKKSNRLRSKTKKPTGINQGVQTRGTETKNKGREGGKIEGGENPCGKKGTAAIRRTEWQPSCVSHGK